MEYAFHIYNTLAETGIYLALEKCLGALQAPPVVVCVGSDLALGDSLGPVTGTMLTSRKTRFCGYIYGTLRAPVTAKEVKYVGQFLRKTHPESKIIAVDAAVGDESEIGLVKVVPGALRPGAGANKRLPKVGDVSVMGIVAKKSPLAYPLLHLTRFASVYAMAEIIAGALSSLSVERRSNNFVNNSQKIISNDNFPNKRRETALI